MKPNALFFEFTKNQNILCRHDALWANENFIVWGGNAQVRPRVYELGDRVVVIQGHPIINKSIDDKKILNAISVTKIEELAPLLDGSFLLLVYQISENKIQIIEAILKLASNNELRTKYGLNARKKALLFEKSEVLKNFINKILFTIN